MNTASISGLTPLEDCACGTRPMLRVETPLNDDMVMFRYECQSCLAVGPWTHTENGARDSWNEFAVKEKEQWPPCCRCGEPTAPDGYLHPVTGEVYCAICAEDCGFYEINPH